MQGLGDPYLLFVQARARGYFSAGSFGVVRGNKIHTFNTGTHSSVEGDSRHLLTDKSLFDVASVTKTIPIALLIFWAITAEYLSLETEISVFFPELKFMGDESPKIKHLLSYTCRLGLDHVEVPYTQYGGSDGLLQKILCADITVRHSMFYGNYPPILLGLILEKVTCMTVHALAQEIIFEPLELTATFNPPQDESLVVKTEINPVTQKALCGEVHDELTLALGRPGSAGLFASTTDLLYILRFLLDRGMIGGRMVVSPELIDQMGVSQTSQGVGFGLGTGIWPVFASGFKEEENFPNVDPEMLKGAYFKNGYTGCSVFVFPKLDLGITINTNHVHPVRSGNSLWINRFRYATVMTILSGKVPLATRLLWGV